MRKFEIADRIITDDSLPFIIAEIGQNHCGDYEKAKELINAAVQCGCDAVKFQKRTNKELYTKELYDSPYLGPQSFGTTYGQHREVLELNICLHEALKHHAEKQNIIYFATAFDPKSADELRSIDVPAFKIASGDLKNTPLIRYISTFDKPMIISTGGGTLEDCKRAAHSMLHNNFAFLHCVASYPNQPHEMNLRAINTLRLNFPDTIIGLSDHYNGICMSTAAYVLGARIFEKHFTLNHTWKGTDHALSLEPKGMHDMVRDLVRVHYAMGDGTKKRLASEEAPLRKMEKGLYFRHDMKVGDTIQVSDLDVKSPSAELYPYQGVDVTLQILNRDVKAGEPITMEAIK
jgi:N-acetylneuraminate synthase/sialic acid synthase